MNRAVLQLLAFCAVNRVASEAASECTSPGADPDDTSLLQSQLGAIQAEDWTPYQAGYKHASGSKQTSGLEKTVEQLGARIDELKKKVDALGGTPCSSSCGKEIDALAKKVDALAAGPSGVDFSGRAHGAFGNTACNFSILLRSDFKTVAGKKYGQQQAEETLHTMCQAAGVMDKCGGPVFHSQSGADKNYGFSELFFDNLPEYQRALAALEMASDVKLSQDGLYGSAGPKSYYYAGAIMRAGAVEPYDKCPAKCMGREYHVLIQHENTDECYKTSDVAAQLGLFAYPKEQFTKRHGGASLLYQIYATNEKTLDAMVAVINDPTYGAGQYPQCKYSAKKFFNSKCAHDAPKGSNTL